jgi:thymidylate kinase
VRLEAGRRGLLVVVLGPDGSGKSTLIKHLVETTRHAFRGNLLFHWRPGLLWQRRQTSDCTDPHGRAPHSAFWSVARVLSHLFDYWAGYLFQIRKALASSRLVIFDRYYYDLLVDARRYRYGGPRWLITALKPLVPKPDLVLILDAPEHTLLSRKQEVELSEMRRQRNEYRKLALTIPNARLLATDREVAELAGMAVEAIIEISAGRYPALQCVDY